MDKDFSISLPEGLTVDQEKLAPAKIIIRRGIEKGDKWELQSMLAELEQLKKQLTFERRRFEFVREQRDLYIRKWSRSSGNNFGQAEYDCNRDLELLK